MSIDYSAYVWYGIFVPREELPLLFMDSQFPDDPSETLDNACQKISGLGFLPVNRGFDSNSIGYGICYGKFVDEISPYEPIQEINVKMSQEDIFSAYDKLRQICEELNIEFAEPKWYVSFCVS